MSVEKVKENFLKECKEEFENTYKELKGKNIVFWGSGSYCEMMLQAFEDIGLFQYIVAICDNNEARWGSEKHGVKICDIGKVQKEYEDFIVIVCSQFKNEIVEGLKEKSIPYFVWPELLVFIEHIYSGWIYKTSMVPALVDPFVWFEKYDYLFEHGVQEKIQQVLDLLEDDESKFIVNNRIKFFRTGKLEYLKQLPVLPDMYFKQEYYPISDMETFVDIGAFDGDSVRDFINAVNGNYKKIFVYEPDPDSLEKIKVMIGEQKIEDIIVEPYAVGNENKEVRFFNNASSSSRITDDGEIVVNMKKLDDLIQEPVSLIKMDIEGAEVPALQGAIGLIKKYHPKLAISIYHRCEDIYEIPLMIHEMVPEYKFKIRHHTSAIYETVLYAWIEK